MNAIQKLDQVLKLLAADKKTDKKLDMLLSRFGSLEAELKSLKKFLKQNLTLAKRLADDSDLKQKKDDEFQNILKNITDTLRE